MPSISATDAHPRLTAAVGDTTMSYVATGSGDPIVLVHGNPTSSYLWRNIIPHLSKHGRCLAPDLVGMGRSRPSGTGSYRFVDHYRYFAEWMDAVGATERVTLVVHDWGSALGFHWAHQHPDRVEAIAYMEAIVQPMAWGDWPDQARSIFELMRGEPGEELVLEKNFFVERILPSSVIRDLTAEEMAEYRRPFAQPGESRRPTLSWPREIPLDGEPADVAELVAAYGAWLAGSAVPKLFVNADPGTILIGRQREFCRTWPNQTEVTVNGLHFIQEDAPDDIGAAIATFLEALA